MPSAWVCAGLRSTEQVRVYFRKYRALRKVRTQRDPAPLRMVRHGLHPSRPGLIAVRSPHARCDPLQANSASANGDGSNSDSDVNGYEPDTGVRSRSQGPRIRSQATAQAVPSRSVVSSASGAAPRTRHPPCGCVVAAEHARYRQWKRQPMT